MNQKPGLTREFWRGLGYALIPSLLLWWVVLFIVAKILQ